MAQNRKKEKMVRFQVEITETYLSELKDLQELGDASSNKELLNNAIALLKWAVAQKQKGYSIAAIDDNGKIQREVLLPFLEQAAAKQTKHYLKVVNQ